MIFSKITVIILMSHYDARLCQIFLMSHKTPLTFHPSSKELHISWVIDKS